MKWVDLAQDLTAKARRDFKVGQVLFFTEPKPHGTQFKIMRKSNGKIWAKQVYMYKPEEIFTKEK